MKGIYLLLGSNLGDSLAMLKRATGLVEKKIGKVVNASSVYATKAWGIEDQPDFLNQVVEVDSAQEPEVILSNANAIEKELGRIRKIKWHSRIIDIDILHYGKLIVNTKNLVIPHAENENRKFVLFPMAEIAPDFIHPKLNKTQEALLIGCKDKLGVEKLDS